LKLALRTEQKSKGGALSPELPQGPNQYTCPQSNCLKKNIAGLRGIFHRVEGSSKGGAQCNIK